jgi:hypothetical protein
MLNLLSFNPFFRLTAFECLTQCKIFDEVRDAKKEAGLRFMRSKQKEKTLINLPIDSKKAFDYENVDNAKYSVSELR